MVNLPHKMTFRDPWAQNCFHCLPLLPPTQPLWHINALPNPYFLLLAFFSFFMIISILIISIYGEPEVLKKTISDSKKCWLWELVPIVQISGTVDSNSTFETLTRSRYLVAGWSWRRRMILMMLKNYKAMKRRILYFFLHFLSTWCKTTNASVFLFYMRL